MTPVLNAKVSKRMLVFNLNFRFEILDSKLQIQMPSLTTVRDAPLWQSSPAKLHDSLAANEADEEPTKSLTTYLADQVARSCESHESHAQMEITETVKKQCAIERDRLRSLLDFTSELSRRAKEPKMFVTELAIRR